MLQFYFMSILLNAAAGYVLVTDGKPETLLESGIRFSIGNESYRLVLGILTIVTGLLKVLSSVERDIPIIGDIIPALVGFAAGFILVFEYYRNHSSLEAENFEKVEQILIKNKKIVGIFSIVSAVLHFLFPRVLFL